MPKPLTYRRRLPRPAITKLMSKYKAATSRKSTAPFTELELQFFAEGELLEQEQDGVDNFEDLDEKPPRPRH